MEHLIFLSKLFDFTQLKVQAAAFYAVFTSVFLVSVTAFCQHFLGISAILFFLLFMIMVTDFITGLMASKREGSVFVSKKGLGWVFKFGSYLIFLAVSISLRKEFISKGLDWIIMPFMLIHYYGLSMILYWETKSIDENLKRLGYSLPIFTFLDTVFITVKGLFTKRIENV